MSPEDEPQVIDAIRTMYEALAADDLALFHSVAASDFYAFDGGKRFDGDALMSFIKSLHDSGNVYVWTVNEPQVELDCNTASITYVNWGSRTNANGKQDLSWLESAFLAKQAGKWRIRFFHSTRVPPAA